MKRLALATLFFFAAALLAPGASYAQQTTPTATPLNIPITGTGPGGTFTGTFQLQKFAVSQGQVVANGLLTGVLTTASGVTTSVVRNISLPVAVTQATCDILHLDLGPLHLNVLGLEIDLSQIVLDITAQSGPGNLLGNLLCSVANLLNNPGGLAGLLNNILALLG